MPRPSTSTTTTTTTTTTTSTSSASLSAAPAPTRRKSKSPNLAANGTHSTTAAMSRTASSRSGGGSTAMSRTTSTSSTGSSWGVQWLNSVLNPPDDPAPAPTSSSSTHPRRRGRRRDDASHSAAHKRATSPDPDTAAGNQEGEEGEQSTLVYVHTVKPTDTLEGIAITYNTTRDALRRANGMWAQDGVGSRKTLLLPVDSCGTKGATVSAPPPEAGDKVGEEEEEGERRYKHHSYVTIPHVGTVQIARLPRKKLSHFPPRRRRSHRSHTRGVSPGGDDYSAHRELLAPADVFRGMTAGVGDLHPHTTHGGHGHGGHTNEQTVTIGPTFKTLSELAQDTAVGLENVGSVVEGFVRRWTVKASDFVGGDLIELTQQLGFNEGGGQGMERSLSGSGGGGGGGSGGGSGRSTGGGVERRVVRERLPRREGERRKVL
ncbi:uncharacterized protein H6S33_001789 [Morchella sextelata]|uniref:uncharacterized protein n=1 Tax=Morchella sextelata TaxID=1174677 RepID=UPI001D049710|nr:uncharacterized protein H6S33_001789 [Morchella sextelata]KAH0608655.1 hypothetical protein H6S33_001789 [Morchella sextelata]